MSSGYKSVTLRFRPSIFSGIVERAENQHSTATSFCHSLVMSALEEAAQADRLAALEQRLLFAIQEVPTQTAAILAPAED